MSPSAVLQAFQLGFQWPMLDPFLFCAHHNDDYPAGNEHMGPVASLSGRNIGQDFAGKDGWNMYHGDVIPGFPHHPHRGFETVTLVRRGYIDHADSLGATARFGQGDVQWLTAGKGINHSEMFPLLRRDAGNPLELFQIWLNLPRESKMVDPYFTMLWSENIPTVAHRDETGKVTSITVVAGRWDGVKPLPPPPDSWAGRSDSEVAIWTIRMEPGARYTLPPGAPGLNRVLYFFEGDTIRVEGAGLDRHAGLHLRSDAALPIENGGTASEFLLLQGRPIGQPVAQHGPFVMNSPEEIRQAFVDYQRTQFGGWPWPSTGPVHAREEGRFARHADGRVEKRERAEGS